MSKLKFKPEDFENCPWKCNPPHSLEPIEMCEVAQKVFDVWWEKHQAKTKIVLDRAFDDGYDKGYKSGQWDAI